MKSIFLDQNHWIYLAQDYWGAPQRRSHTGIAAAVLGAVHAGEIRLPLSITHFIEATRAASPARRAQLAEVFDRFSNGWFMAAWSTVLAWEIEITVRSTFGNAPDGMGFEVIGRGFLHGVQSDVRELLEERFTPDQIAAFEHLASLPGAVYDYLTGLYKEERQRQNEGVRELDRNGVAAAEDLRVKRRSYSVETHRRAHYAGYTMQFQDFLISALESIGKTKQDFLDLGLSGLMSFWSNVPSLDVDCELTLYRDRQWTRSAKEGDVRDIANLALAIPYCDIVLTEKLWSRAVAECRLAEKYDTLVVDDLARLKEAIGA